MIDYNLIQIFIKAAETESFTQTARVLNLPKSKVSRAVAKLEAQMHVQLLRRTTRKISLTSSGEDFLSKVRPLFLTMSSEIEKISDAQTEVAGKIRITASETIAQTFLPQIISTFHHKYPRVKIETLISSDNLNLAQEEIDVAFRANKLENSSLIQKRFKTLKFILACSNHYLQKYGRPNTYEELEHHKLLAFKPMEQLLLKKKSAVSPYLTSNSVSMLLEMTLANQGISILPDFLCNEHFDSKKLVQVLPAICSKPETINILYPSNKNMPLRTRAFLDTIKQLEL